MVVITGRRFVQGLGRVRVRVRISHFLELCIFTALTRTWAENTHLNKVATSESWDRHQTNSTASSSREQLDAKTVRIFRIQLLFYYLLLTSVDRKSRLRNTCLLYNLVYKRAQVVVEADRKWIRWKRKNDEVQEKKWRIVQHRSHEQTGGVSWESRQRETWGKSKWFGNKIHEEEQRKASSFNAIKRKSTCRQNTPRNAERKKSRNVEQKSN